MSASSLSYAYPKRRRATKAEMAARRSALINIVAEQQPMSVRQVFYQATVRNLVPKTENGYQMVAKELGDLRRAALIPFLLARSICKVLVYAGVRQRWSWKRVRIGPVFLWPSRPYRGQSR